MTLDELRTLVQGAAWFRKLGTYPAGGRALALRDLESPEDPDEWDWLPTTADEPDPIHHPPLREVARSEGRADELCAAVNELYRLTLASLRRAPDDHPLLHAQNSDFTPAARGPALFAVRMAVAEIVMDRPSFWCSVVPLYAEDYWPCGLTDDGRVVVL